MAKKPSIQLALDVDADELLARDPFALLVGMLLDQQIPMDRAFAGPKKIAERMGMAKRLDPAAIAAADPEEFAAVMATPPAVHRFPASMAGRVQTLAQIVLDQYNGNAAAVWREAADGQDLVKRLSALPGFGVQKAKIFGALIGKQLDVTPTGWREATAPFGEAGSYLSVADVVDAASLAKVREHKQQMKAAAKAKSGS